MKKLPIILFMSLSSFVYADTLTEVIQRTLETNPEVLMSVNNRRAIDQTLKQAQSGYWPTVGLTGGYGRERSDNVTTRNMGEDVTLTRQEMGLTLSQMLFDGFSVKHKIARQNSLVNSAAYKVQNTSENIALITAEVYLEILRRQELLELSKDNVVIHQKILEQIRILVEGGAGRLADVQQSRGRLALAKSSLVNAEGHLRNAQINYQRITGELPKELTMPPRAPLEAALATNQKTALDIALNNHPSLRTAKADLEATRAEREHAKSAFMPHFSLELGITNNKNLDGIEGDNDDMSAMLKMRYNLYRGGYDQARRQETAERIGVSKEEIRRIQRTIKEDVLLSWNSLHTIRARLKHLNMHLKSTEDVLESYKEQFKLGQRSLLDVLDSENEHFNARASLVSAQYTEILSIFKILESTSSLLKTLSINLPKEALEKHID
ncbi:TolC family outer membrane protein [Candidatus Parabeggiatoa sp. HSG14]|uniref:TolC family outer membrane protein n=1 Tax=Candidatus Parabeggiatoa sp. HSG14 TaxID=3055593 RepID=UPI0025A89E4B|nr:TolC family outer membrane protein [Thiotrichales bacterium HSG14]